MPVYEYSCRSCGEKFEAIRGILDDDKKAKCPNCGGDDLSKVFSPFFSGNSQGKFGGFRFPT